MGWSLDTARWLNQRAEAAEAPANVSAVAKPWLLYCSLNIPHPPFDTNLTWYRRSAGRGTGAGRCGSPLPLAARCAAPPLGRCPPQLDAAPPRPQEADLPDGDASGGATTEGEADPPKRKRGKSRRPEGSDQQEEQPQQKDKQHAREEKKNKDAAESGAAAEDIADGTAEAEGESQEERILCKAR